MSLLTYITKFEIDPTRLGDMERQDFIRLEKKLKAEARLNDDWNQNEVEQLLNLISSYGEQCKWLFDRRMNLLRLILEDPEKFRLAKGVVHLPGEVQSLDYPAFLDQYFRKELDRYLERCIRKEYFNALHSLLYYRDLLPHSFVDVVSQRLKRKMEVGIEYMHIRSENLDQKIAYFTNPYFFRCLTQLGSIQFTEQIVDLLKETIDGPIREEYQFQIFFSMQFCELPGDRAEDVLQSNATYAEINGVEEVLVNVYTNKKTGGSSLPRKSQSKNTPVNRSNNHRQTQKRQQPANRRPPQTKKQHALSTSQITWILVIFAVVFFIIVALINSGQRRSYDNLFTNSSNENSSERWEELMAELEESSWEEDVSESEIPEETFSLDDLPIDTEPLFPEGAERKNRSIRLEDPYYESEEDFEEVINYLHDESTFIIKSETIPYDITLTGLNKFKDPIGGVNNLLMVNQTGSPAVIMYKTAYWEIFEFVQPDSALLIPSNTLGFKIYMGEDPRMVDYYDEDGQLKTHFMFNECSDPQLAALDEFYNMDGKNNSDKNYVMRITFEHSDVYDMKRIKFLIRSID